MAMFSRPRSPFGEFFAQAGASLSDRLEDAFRTGFHFLRLGRAAARPAGAHAGRAGPGAADRAGQLGPLKAWAAERTDILRRLLAAELALYGEWLYLTHTVAYERLPSFFVALDLRRPDGSFLTVDERTAACEAAGVAVPPQLWRGTAHGLGDIERLLGTSRYGPAPAEGVFVRTVDGSEPRVAQLLGPQFNRLPDDAWAVGRPRNGMADGNAAWR